MNRVLECIVFGGVALVVHAGAWVGIKPDGLESSGEAGEASVSLQASSSELSSLIATWTRPVDAMRHVSDGLDAPIPDQFSAPPSPQPHVPSLQKRAKNVVLPIPMQPSPPEAPPNVDTASPKRAVVENNPQASHRPVARPAKPTSVEVQKPPTGNIRKAQAITTTTQKAIGGNNGKNGGKARSVQSQTLSKAARNSLMAQWGASIRNGVERRKRYPSDTKASGTTVLRIAVSRTGRLAQVSVVKSSGNRKLDQAAVKAVRQAEYPAAPNGLSEAQYRFNLPLSFTRK